MKKNILIYPCGADNAIEVYDSIRYSVHFNVYGANSHDSIADLYIENPIVHLPNISDENFIQKLNYVIDDYNIDLIFPTHDDIVYYFSQHLSDINTTIIGADRKINELSRYKKKTYAFFEEFYFTPRIFTSISDINEFPVFVKPDIGHGSLGAFKVNSSQEIEESVFLDNVVSEYLPGKEYTIDCFSDKNNQLLYAFPRERNIIRNGVSHKNIEPGKSTINKCFEIAKKINDQLDFKGLWFFQLKENKSGNLKLLEICPRIATTMAFDRYKGVNLPLLTTFAYLDMDVKIRIFHKDVVLYRYSQTKPKYNYSYQKVFIDFDDTIIINQKVCLDAIAFIYQCKNENKKVYLITKHEFDIIATLNNYNIPESLFDEIICMDLNEDKYKYIKDSQFSIFIDNFYKERKEVFEYLNIPVFDVEGIKTLLNN